MKTKEVFVTQEVAMSNTPKSHLGTIVSIKDSETVIVQFTGTESTAAYGIKVLVEYKGE